MNKLLLAVPLLAMGCYKIDYINSGVQASGGTTDIWSHRLANGLIEFEETEVEEQCPNGFAQIHTEVSVLNGIAQRIPGFLPPFGGTPLVGWWWIYTPSTISITCAASKAPAE